MKKSVAGLAFAGAILIGAASGVGAQSAIDRVLAGTGGATAVAAVARPLDDAINMVLFASGVANRNRTKVVPIIQLGGKTAIGAAQVSGPAATVAAVRAIAAIRGQWDNGAWQFDALIPVATADPMHGVKRVDGVGVDAIIGGRPGASRT